MIITLLIATITLLLIVVIVMTADLCFLDVLNIEIARQCKFKNFYAGTENTPKVIDVVPEVRDLEDNFQQVRAEMQQVLARKGDKIPQMTDVYNNIFVSKGSGAGKNVFVNFVAGMATQLIYGSDTEIFDRIGTKKWRTHNLIMFGHEIPGNMCPQTVKFLRQIPGVQSALLSFIAPGTYIPPHSDPAKGVIRYHLALQVPADREKCFIVVNGEKYCWTTGQSVLFDDAFEHWVRNDTDEERVILFVDILRPLTGFANLLQQIANLANKYHPGVRQAIRESAKHAT